MPQDYNATINLPRTDFPMRAGLPKREPDMLAELYEKKIYAHSFLKMARMGFLSYDKTNISSPIDDAFHLVATPRYFNSPIAQIFCRIMRIPSFDVPDFNPAHPLVLNSMLYNIPSYR